MPEWAKKDPRRPRLRPADRFFSLRSDSLLNIADGVFGRYQLFLLPLVELGEPVSLRRLEAYTRDEMRPKSDILA